MLFATNNPINLYACAGGTVCRDDGKIARQNIAWTKTPCTNATADAAGVAASWQNHFVAFGSQEVPRILLDYTEASVLKS